ncbi:MAG: NfeD family protein [Chitinophagales bacterium]
MFSIFTSRMLCTAIFLSSLFWTITQTYAQDIVKNEKKIYAFDIHQDIMPSAWRTVKRAVEEAEAQNVDAIFISMDTYGGLLDAADSIRTKLLETKIPVIVHITNNAASAGALISIACDSIYMSPYAKIGAASVVDQSGQVVADKYQSYMRGMMRATAEATGRNPDYAEAMVGAIKTIPGIIDSGKVLTFTTKEAIANGFCNAEVNSEQEALAKAGYPNAEIIRHKKTFIDALMGFFMNPIVHGLCLTFIFLGLYFELQTPGIGFPLIIAILAALFYFAPLYLDGLAENWEILLFIIGIGLIVLEIFVVPGFGVTGIAGLTLVFIAAILSMIGNVGFNFELTGGSEMIQATAVVLGSFVLTIAIVLAFMKQFLRSPFFRKITLQTEMRTDENYTTTIFNDIPSLLGKEGIAETDLRPSGKIFIENEYYEGQTNGEYVLKGKKIKVIEVKNMYLIVKEIV